MGFQSKKCASLTPYVCGEQPQDKKYIKLNTNENPYAPSKDIIALLKNYDTDKLKLYPDPENLLLKQALSEVYNLPIEDIFVGNGSDEVLAMCFSAFMETDGVGVAFCDITYSFYPVFADYFNIKADIVSLFDNYTVNLDGLCSSSAKVILICNPNAPTAIAISRSEIISAVKYHPNKLFIIDEAYADFGENSVVDAVVDYDNLIVVRTFSKSHSLAGVRCGYALGNKDLITALNKVKNSFNSYTVNRITERICKMAILDVKYNRQCVEKVKNTRFWTTEQLENLGFYVLPSSANFVFAKKDGISGVELYQKLKELGILVRYFGIDLLKDFIRISIGSDDEMKELISCLKSIIA